MATLKTKDDSSLENKEVGNVVVSLSQAMLAPLDALFKSQIHAARSFLNLILQLGYPHDDQAAAGTGDEPPPGPQKPFELEFAYSANDPVSNVSKDYVIKVPQLALVPINALTIDSAEIKMGLNVTHVDEHSQMQDSRADPEAHRPWYLVQNPISLQGTISSNSSSSSKGTDTSNTSIDITIKLSKSSIPAALDNLLVSLSKSTEIKQS